MRILFSIWLLVINLWGQTSVASGPVTISGTTIFGGTNGPALPATALLNWDTTPNNAPASGPYICVGTLANAAAIPGGCSVTYTTAQLQTAINTAVCGDIFVIQDLPALSNLVIPDVPCTQSNWVVVEHDITDTSGNPFPLEGYQIDPSFMGIPHSAMPFPYPGWNPAPNSTVRHVPQLLATASSNVAPISLKIPTSGTGIAAAAYWFFDGIELGRDPSADMLTVGGVNLTYNPGQQGAPNLTQDCSVTLTSGQITNSSLPINAAACRSVQPNHIVFDHWIIDGDAQRQTTRGINFGGAQWISFQNGYGYDIQLTTAGGGGDAQFYFAGGGHGYTDVGLYKWFNNFTSSSSMACLFCGSYTEPVSPVTLADGVPHDVHGYQTFMFKNPHWATQMGQALLESETIEGTTYPQANDQELLVNPSAVSVAQGQSYQMQLYWGNDSFGGLNRMGTSGSTGGGTIVVDGFACTFSANLCLPNGDSTHGIVTLNGEHNVGSGAWLSQNQITYTYAACSGSGSPAGCTGVTTTGAHTFVANAIAVDNRLATLALVRNLASNTATVTVVGSNPAHSIAVSPNIPDLQIQPSYSDSNGNTRQFCGEFYQIPNFTPASITWKVDGIAGGNSSVGTITTPTGVDPSGAVYCSGTSTGNHTIVATDGAVTSPGSVINVNNTAPLLGYDWKPFNVKNGGEFKCGNRILFENFKVELGFGSDGNGGFQHGEPWIMQAINQASQNLDGSGNCTGTIVGGVCTNGYGPAYVANVTMRNGLFQHFGFGFVIIPLNVAKGVHDVALLDLVCDDCNYRRWGDGTTPIPNDIQTGGVGAANVLSYTSPSIPTAYNISVRHLTMTGLTAIPFSITNNLAQFPIKNFTFQDSNFPANGSQTFKNDTGETNDCNTASGTGSTNTEARSLAACIFPYVFDHVNLADSTASPSVFTSSPIWQIASTSIGYVNYNGGNGGDYRLCKGLNNPAAPCTTASVFAQGQTNQSSDGLDNFANVAAVNAAAAQAANGH